MNIILLSSKKTKINIFLFLMLSTSFPTQSTESASSKNAEVSIIIPLQQGDMLDLSEFIELYVTPGSDPILSKIVTLGTGSKALIGEMMTVHYTGCLPATMDTTKKMMTRSKIEKAIKVGSKFDSSLDRGQPFQFKLGAKQVISGWDFIVAQMKIGEKRIVILPANHAYGNRAAGKIPANSTLIFEIELIQAL